jgi:hypothetical protein
MAMTETTKPTRSGAPRTAGGDSAGGMSMAGAETLERATVALRSHVDDGWTSAWQRTLERLVTATRRTRRVAGSSGTDRYFVSDQVVAVSLRSAVDEVAGTQALAIDVSLDGHDLIGLRLEVSMAYGTPLRAHAVVVRHAVRRCLAEVLGDPAHRVGSRGIEIHIVDVHLPGHSEGARRN